MGLFDKIFGGHESKELSRAEAFAGVLLGAVASDGHISGEEGQGLCTILGRMKMYDNWNDAKFNNMLNRLLGMIKREGVEPVLRRCAEVLPKQLHETAFANACDLVLADGVVEPAEKQFLETLRGLLEIDGDQALTIVQVMVIKNRG
jgi:tellurite resistance protein